MKARDDQRVRQGRGDRRGADASGARSSCSTASSRCSTGRVRRAGQLKDQGLRALLRRFAAAPPAADHGLIVLTSRLAVADIQRFKEDAAPVVDVEKLSDEAGAELLRDNDVWGVDRDLKAASHDFGGHPLALTLLASLIKETQNGDVRRRDHIRGLLADADNPRHDHARRVMESYEKEWLADQPILLADPPFRRPVRPPGERRLPQGAARRACDSRADRCDRRSQRRRNGGAPSRDCAKCGCSRRSTRPIPKRSTPIRWCANGSANGCGGRTKRRGKPRTAASTTICATRRTKAKRRRSPTSRRSITPSPTAAAPGDTRRRWTKSTGTAFAAGMPNGAIEFYAVRQLGRLWQRSRGDLLVL